MQAKQTAMEEMTQGQAATLVRNEQIIDQAAEEMDDLEEMLNESISDSMRSTREKAAGQGKQQKKRCWSACNLFRRLMYLESTAVQSTHAVQMSERRGKHRAKKGPFLTGRLNKDAFHVLSLGKLRVSHVITS